MKLTFQGKVNSNSQLNPSLITLWESPEKAFPGSDLFLLYVSGFTPYLAFFPPPCFGISGEVKNQSIWTKISIETSDLFIPYWDFIPKTSNLQNSNQEASSWGRWHFLYEIICIEERWPFSSPIHTPVSGSSLLAFFLKSVATILVAHQKQKIQYCFYVRIISRRTPSNLEGFGMLKSNSSLQKPRKRSQGHCAIFFSSPAERVSFIKLMQSSFPRQTNMDLKQPSSK